MSDNHLVRLIAFYLPQFHPIPENDRWWGKGFTEWTNVAMAKPLFKGHYQPHIPADLGFYDLRLPEVRRAQAGLAKEYGIYGFCYYHYWFNGKRLLGRPFDEVLKSGEPDFPFCLCWANENWTRSWDGQEKEILIKQEYSEEDDLQHILWLAQAFKDERYIRIDGKPIILIYRAGRIPNPVRTAETWRNEARRLGVGEIYLCRVESFPEEHQNPSIIGFDASVEFQPDWAHLGEPLLDRVYKDYMVFRYVDIVERMMNKDNVSYKRFPCVTPSWDNSPRRKSRAWIFIESNPEIYERWIRKNLKELNPSKPEENLVFINAWNEWGEGNHLEPDHRFGRSFLEATKRVLHEFESTGEIRDPKDVITPKGKQFATPSGRYGHSCSKHDEEPIKFNCTMKYPLVYIIILNWNGLQDTIVCLNSVAKLNYPTFRLVVVDNGSTDGSADIISRHYPKIDIIKNEKNLGYAEGNNAGIRYALENNADYLWLLNNDTAVEQDALLNMVTEAEKDPLIGIIGSKICYLNNPYKIWFAGAMINWSRGISTPIGLNETDVGQYDSVKEVDRVAGCSMLVRSEVCNSVGLLDEKFFLYVEEVDWCVRARQVGFKCLFVPSSIVYHKASASIPLIGPLSKVFNYYDTRNFLYLVQKSFYFPVREIILMKLIARKLWDERRNILKMVFFMIHSLNKISAYEFPVLFGLRDFLIKKMGKVNYIFKD